MTVTDILQKIRDTGSSNQKLEILKQNNTEPTIRKIMYLVYEPTLVFGIKKIPEYTPSGTRSLAEVVDEFAIAINNGELFNSTEQRDRVAAWLSELSETDAHWFVHVLTRDLNIGVATKTVAKAFGGKFVTQERYMRCSLLNSKTQKKVKYPAILQVKEDGQYCDVIVHNGTVTFMSRNLRQHDFAQRLTPAILDAARRSGNTETVLQGEIRVFDPDYHQYLPRKTGNGLVQRVFKSSEPDTSIIDRFVFVLWDAVPYADWQQGESQVQYSTRFDLVGRFVDSVTEQFKKIQSKTVNSLEEATKEYMRLVAQGEEGAVLKNQHLKWKNGTSGDQFKMKVEFSVDLEAVEFIPGDPLGQHANTFGSVRCVTSDGKLECNVSGFKDAEREYFFANPNEILGQIVEVKSNDIVQAEKREVYSLFHPRFVEVRDKTQADDFAKVVSTLESVTGFKKMFS